MANTNDLISTLKKEINSILVSAGAEVTLRQLEVDYHALIGKAIPYREAGRTSLEELILSMPDAVTTRWWNGELKLRAITNERNEHVAKLVSLAKNKPKTSYRPNRKSSIRQHQQPPLSSMTTRNNFVSVRTTNTTTAASNADYNMLRGEILNLMLGYRKGLEGSQFADAYAKRYGNYRKLSDSGFPTILAMLRSMPDVVDIEFHEKDYKVHGKLGQRKPNGSGINLAYNGDSACNGNGVTSGPKENKHNCNGVDVNAKFPGSLSKSVNGKTNQLSEMPHDDAEDSENWNEELNETVTGDVKSNIQKVLSMHPNGLYASKFIAEYKKFHGTELVVKKLGYQTVIALLADLPEIVVIERPSNGDWLVFDKRTYRKELIHKVLHSKGEYLPPTPTLFDFRHSLRTVLEANQDGVQHKDLEGIYEKSVHQSVNPQHLGFQNLDRLLEAVGDMAEVVYMGAGRVMVKLVKTQHKTCNGYQKTGKADLSLAPFLPTTHGNLPKDVAVDGHIYAKQEPPEPSADYIDVMVSEVRDPSHFFFQLKAKKPALEHLMDNLQAFYHHPSGKDYVVPSEMIKVGLVCVGQYPDNLEWHRCLILELKEDLAKVSYVDYGTEGFISQTSLRLITLHFLSALPAQAIGGRLSKIAPVGKYWTQEATNRFYNLVHDRYLSARVTDTSNDEPFAVSLTLSEISRREDEYDIHINDYLFEAGHAIFCVKKESQEEDAVAHVKEEVRAAADKYIACNDEEDDDDYEFSSSESEMESMVVSLKPAVAKTLQPNADRVNETASVSGHLFKFVQLTPEYSFHLINMDEKAYIISSEVSSFFWEDDLIRPLLRNQGKAVSKLVLTEDEHGEILKQLFDAKLPGTSRNGMPSQMVVLYALSSVVEILELFHHPSEELKLAVQQQLDLFNAQDSYWTGTKERQTHKWSSDLEQDLRRAWNDLQNKREANLRLIKNAPVSETARLVEEIEDIEAKLLTVKTRIDQLTYRKSTSVLSFGSLKAASVNHVISSQQDRLDLGQNTAESALPSVPWNISSSSNSSGNSWSTSRSILSTNDVASRAIVNNLTHLPAATSLPVSLVGASNRVVNPMPSLSVPHQTSFTLSHHSSEICGQPSSNNDYANVLAPSMSVMSLGGIQTRMPGYAASLPSSGTTSLTYSNGYQVPCNNGLVSNLPLILNNSSLPSFNHVQYNPLLLGSMPYPSAGSYYIPGPYNSNGVFTTPGLLPSLSMFTKLASGGLSSDLALPNPYFAGNPNMPNVPH